MYPPFVVVTEVWLEIQQFSHTQKNIFENVVCKIAAILAYCGNNSDPPHLSPSRSLLEVSQSWKQQINPSTSQLFLNKHETVLAKMIYPQLSYLPDLHVCGFCVTSLMDVATIIII